MFKKRTLDEIGIKYNAEKASRETCDGRVFLGRCYLQYFEFFLSSLEKQKFTIIELGVADGASLKTWRDYFVNAQIVGVDIRPETRIEEERIDFICCDSASPLLLDKIKKYKGTIKCIVDDSSHSWGNQRTTFEMLFPILESGGYYIVEDLEFGSKGTWVEPCCLDAQPFFDYATDRLNIMRTSINKDRKKQRPFFEQLPLHIQQIELSLDFVTFVPGMIIFRKK